MKHPTLAVIGLAIIAFLCLQLLRETITLPTAAGRAVVTVVVLAVVDRLLVPIGRALLHTPGRAEPGAGDSRPELDVNGGEPQR